MDFREGFRGLHWDKWNVEHIGKHGVVPQEVEEVIAGWAVLRDG